MEEILHFNGENGRFNEGRKIVDHISLMYAYIREHGIDPLQELVKKDPERAIVEFPKFMERVLSAGNHFFSGYMCGGPAPEASVPLLNILGSMYPLLNRDLRSLALRESLNFLDGLNYDNAQNNVELIHEPWLVGDIIINRWLYWCGYQQYIDMLADATTWEDVKRKFVRKTDFRNVSPQDLSNLGVVLEEIETRASDFVRRHCSSLDLLDVSSTFWFAYTLAQKEYTTPEIRNKFAGLFPDIMGRTLDAVAADIAYKSAYFETIEQQDKRVHYKEGIESRLKLFDDRLRKGLIRKINEKKWILFSEHPNVRAASFLESDDAKV